MFTISTFTKRTGIQCFSSTAAAAAAAGTGKSALVTGGAMGLGEAISRRLAKDGYSVFIADINKEIGQAVANDIGGTFLQVNVEKPEQVQEAISNVVSSHGTLDALVNNAGVVPAQVPLGETSLEDWERVLNINLNGTFYGMKYGLSQMAKQEGRGGNIVNLSSTAGFRGMCNLAPYIASKFAVRGLTQAAAVEYGFKNIRVNAIAPTGCETPMVKAFIDSSPDPEGMKENLTAGNAVPGLVQPSDIANAVAFLLSDEAKYITGHTLPVDAGSLSRAANTREHFNVK